MRPLPRCCTTAVGSRLHRCQATASRKSLDDVMRDLYARLGNTSKPLTNQELQATANRIAGSDFGGFFRRYVMGREQIPVASHLSAIGVELDSTNRLRLIKSPTARQSAARRSYFGPKAVYAGGVPEWTTRGHDPDVMGGRFDPSGRYDIVMRIPAGDMPLTVSVAAAAGENPKLTAIVAGTGGSYVADEATVAGTKLRVAFTAHGTKIQLEFQATLTGVNGTCNKIERSVKLDEKKRRPLWASRGQPAGAG
jgi:hypothetical protein